MNNRKKSTKLGKNLEGGGGKFFWMARIYTSDIRKEGWKRMIERKQEKAEL